MSEKLDVHCPDLDCQGITEVELDNEDLGDGCEHTIECEDCKKKILYSIGYCPSAYSECIVE